MSSDSRPGSSLSPRRTTSLAIPRGGLSATGTSRSIHLASSIYMEANHFLRESARGMRKARAAAFVPCRLLRPEDPSLSPPQTAGKKGGSPSRAPKPEDKFAFYYVVG